MIELHRIVNSLINSCTYVLSAGNDCWLIDVGDIEPIMKYVGGRSVKGAFLTHVHYDHIYGLNELMKHFPDAKIYTMADGKEALQSTKMNFSKYHPEIEPFSLENTDNVVLMEDEEILKLTENDELKVICVPGHDVTSVAYMLDDMLFTGDSYIPNCKLVCSFPRSNRKLAKENEQRLKDLEASGMKIMPGHWIENK